MKLVDLKVLWLPGGGLLNPIPDGCPLSRAESARQPHLPISSARPPSRVLGFLVPDQRRGLLLNFYSESHLSAPSFLPAAILSKWAWMPGS